MSRQKLKKKKWSNQKVLVIKVVLMIWYLYVKNIVLRQIQLIVDKTNNLEMKKKTLKTGFFFIVLVIEKKTS